VEALAQAILNRLLHEPTLRMKELRDGRTHARMALVRELFGLQDEGSAQQPAARGTEAPQSQGGLAEVRELRRR
jgi:glutamyl-tRNA reductase